MQATPLPTMSSRAPTLLRPVALVAALVALLAMSNLGWADSCSTLHLGNKPITCTIPETNPEVALTSTLVGLKFTVQAQGSVLIYDDSTHTLLSDVVTFSNVGGVATVSFVSDTDLIPAAAQGLPVLGSYTESTNPISISLALTNGQVLNAKICSDTESWSCYGASDCISLSTSGTSVPEPGTFVLLGSGLIGSGALRLSAGSAGRRLLKRLRT